MQLSPKHSMPKQSTHYTQTRSFSEHALYTGLEPDLHYHAYACSSDLHHFQWELLDHRQPESPRNLMITVRLSSNYGQTQRHGQPVYPLNLSAQQQQQAVHLITWLALALWLTSASRLRGWFCSTCHP